MSLLADLPRRTKLLALLALGCALVAAGALSFGPVVRARAAQVAARRGIQLEIAQVRPALGGIWLRQIAVRVPQLPGLTVHVAALRVGFGWNMGVASVGVHGALIDVVGEGEELQRQWTAYRADSQSEANSAGSELRFSAEGVDVVWRVRGHEPAQRVWGLSYRRDGAREAISLDLARLG